MQHGAWTYEEDVLLAQYQVRRRPPFPARAARMGGTRRSSESAIAPFE